MVSNSEDFWSSLEKIEQTGGSIAALVFILLVGVLYFGSIFLAGWAVSATLGTPYWMTVLSIGLLKFALK